MRWPKLTIGPYPSRSRWLKIQAITIGVCLLPLLAWIGYEEFLSWQRFNRLNVGARLTSLETHVLPSGGYRVTGELTNPKESRAPIRGIVLGLNIRDCTPETLGRPLSCPVVYKSPDKKVFAYLRPGKSTRFEVDFEMLNIPELRGQPWLEPDLRQVIPDLPD